MTVRLYAGFDPREAVGYHAFSQSLIETSPGVGITPIAGDTDGTNAFTLARFRLFEDNTWSLFVDGCDMICRADIKELWYLRDNKKAVQVVPHDYHPKHSLKYVGTELESPNYAYPRKNQSSVMLINGAHISNFKNRGAIRDALARNDGAFLHRFSWLDDSEIGVLPAEWNWLVGEQQYNPKAKLVHFTNGIPGFDYYAEWDYSDEWRAYAMKAQRGLQYDFQKVSER